MSRDDKTVYYILLLTSINHVACEDSVCSNSVQATRGARVTLCCRPTVDKPVVWFFTGNSRADWEEVSNSGVILKEYIQYYELNTTQRGNYHLVIKSVRSEDVGQYVCQEENGIGQSHHVSLAVSESTNTTGSSREFVQNGTSSGSSGQRKNTSEIVTASIVSVAITLIISGILAFVVIRCLRCKSQRRSSSDKHLLKTYNADWQRVYNDIVACDDRFTTRPAGLTWNFDTLKRNKALYRKYVQLFVDHIQAVYKKPNLPAIVGLQSELNPGGDIAAKLNVEFVSVGTRQPTTVDFHSISLNWRGEEEKKTLYVRSQNCNRGDNVVIVDEKLVTGDNMKAMMNLMGKMGAKVLGCVVLIEDFRRKTREEHIAELNIQLKSFIQVQRAECRGQMTDHSAAASANV